LPNQIVKVNLNLTEYFSDHRKVPFRESEPKMVTIPKPEKPKY